jgi:hypothetical protein
MISFVNDGDGYPSYAFTEESETAFGSFLTSDVQTSGGWLLDFLAWTEDVRVGRVPVESWSGNSWHARIDEEGVHLHDQYTEDWEGHYPLSQAQEILLSYWAFLASGPDWKRAELARWEAGNGREHPLRAGL